MPTVENKEELKLQAVVAQQIELESQIMRFKEEIQAYKKQVTLLQTQINELKKMVNAVSNDQQINVNELLQVLINISKPVNIHVHTDDY
jgi:prefoldin subunit 5